MVIRIAAILLTSVLFTLPAQAQSHDDMLPVPQNLQREAAQAHADRKAFLLMFSLPGCGYCKVVRRNYLMPLLRDASPADRPVIREVAPTVIVVNAEGELLADPIVGGDNNGFYSAYLDRALEAAEKQFTNQRVKVR
jgi:hypothetical protein